MIATLFLLLPSLQNSAQDQTWFAETPGETEFSGRLCVRPLQLEEILASGKALSEALAMREQAVSLVTPWTREFVADTDEYILDLPSGETENSLSTELMATGLFQYAEPDWICFPDETTPNDPQFSQQWQHSKMKSEKAWDFGTGDGTFIACTVDTGVDLNHPDLQANLVSGYNSASNRSQANGGDVSDINGHGTMTLGCVGAIGNNGVGVVGMAWDIKLMPVRATNSSGGGAYLSDLTDGARWASDNGAHSVSVSYGGVDSNSVGTTGTHLRGEESLLCWSSGNSGSRINGYDHANVIVVGATDQSDNVVSWSTYGDLVDVVAPGEGVRTTADGGGYANVSGTSFSAPIVNGVLAMMMLTAPNQSADQIEQMMFDNCVDLASSGEDDYAGHGRPNFFKCLEDADAAGGGGGGSDSINLTGTTNAQGGQNCNWSWSGAPGNSFYGFLYSLSNTGMTYNGHNFDVGSNYTLFRTGMNSSTGSGSLTATIPGHLSNLTVYLEAGAFDGTDYFDSNLVTLTIN